MEVQKQIGVDWQQLRSIYMDFIYEKDQEQIQKKQQVWIWEDD